MSVKSLTRVAALAVVIGLSTSVAQAQLFTSNYNTSLLPSAQGWGYFPFNSALTESQVFSSSGGILTANTIGNGFQGQGSNFAYINAANGTFSAAQDWVVEARVRVLQGQLLSFHYGFSIGAAFDGMNASVGIMPSTFQDSTLVVRARDNSAWTTWRIETDRQNGTFDLFIDGTLITTAAISFGSNGAGFPENYAFLGDGTGGANALAEVQSFSFAQVPIPAPTTAAFLVLGSLMASRRRR